MEARFRHWIKSTKGYCDSYLTILPFHIFVRNKLAIAIYKVRITIYKVTIVS